MTEREEMARLQARSDAADRALAWVTSAAWALSVAVMACAMFVLAGGVV